MAGARDVEEDVWVAVLEVADEEAWRFVDQIQGEEEKGG